MNEQTEQPFIDWPGGKCPVPGEMVVEYRMRDGEISSQRAGHLEWGHFGVESAKLSQASEIIAYRVIPPEQPQASATPEMRWDILGRLAVGIARGEALPSSATEMDDNPVNCVSVLMLRLSESAAELSKVRAELDDACEHASKAERGSWESGRKLAAAIADRDSLRAELSDTRTELSAEIAGHWEQRAHLHAELEREKARLDWLDTRGKDYGQLHGGSSIRPNRTWCVHKEGHGGDLRAAIDSALAAFDALHREERKS